MDHQKMMDLRSNLMPGYHNQIVTLVKFANLFVKCCLQMEGSWANDKVFLCFSCGLWAWDVRSIGDLPDGKPNRVPLVWFLIHRFYKRKSIFTRRINIHFQSLDCLKSIITTIGCDFNPFRWHEKNELSFVQNDTCNIYMQLHHSLESVGEL